VRGDPHSWGRRAARAVASPRGATVLAFVVAWVVLVAAAGSRFLRDPGTFWHVLTGDRIFASGFPRRDWLSFTFGGEPWIAHQWLAECAMSLLHRAGGLDALVVATAAALALLFAWLFHRLLRSGVAMRWALLLAAVAFLGGSHHFHVRPHVVSILLFAWSYALLVDVEAGRRRLRDLLWLWPAFLVWVNSHGAVVGGLGTLALVAAAWCAAAWAGWRTPLVGRRDMPAAAALVIGCCATVLLNPYGLDLVRTWGTILGSRALPRMIVEHASSLRTGAWQVFVLGAAYGVVLVTTPPRRWTATTALLPVVWLVLALQRVRHAPLFAMAATLAMAELLPRSGAVAWLRRRRVDVLGGAPAVAPFPRACAAVAAAGIAVTMLVHRVAPAVAVVRLDPSYWPMSTVPALRTAAAELPSAAPVLNDMELGGFVAYHAPSLRILVDDRWELYGDTFMVESIWAAPAWIERWAARGDARVALASHGSGLDRHLRSAPGWYGVATTPTATLYRRRAWVGAGAPSRPDRGPGGTR
jgi:hypothetical protein